MSEFEIERDPSPPTPSRSVDSSRETDADGGGGTTFVFGGGGGGGEGKGAKEERRPPLPIGPSVELSLSSSACFDIGRESVPGDFGSIGGPVLPPAGIATALERGLAAARSLSQDGGDVPPEGSPPGSVIDLKA